MLNWVKRFKEQDQPPSFHKQWAANAQSFHSAVFTYIESLIVLGALQYATTQSSAWGVWILYFSAYCAQLLLTGIYVRVAILLLLDRSGLKGRGKSAALWLIGLLGLAFNIWFVGALSDVIEQVIAAGLSGVNGGI